MYNVFVVDDEPVIGEGLRHLIDWDAYHCKVWVFQKSAAALEKAFDIKPEIMITDIKMPSMDGLELIGSLKAKGIHCKFIILSGYSEFEYAKKGIGLGVQSYLLKPVEEEEIYKAIDQAIKQIEKETEIESNLRQRQNIVKIREDNLLDIPQEMLCRLEGSIDCMNFNVSRKIVDEIFAKIFGNRPVKLEDLRRYCISILLASVKNLSQYELQMNATLGVNILSLSDATHFDSREKIYHWLINIIKMVIEIKQEQEKLAQNIDPFIRIKRYIDIHYSENISLGSIAEMFYLNPCYLSQLFRKKTGETFLSYVAKRRIEKAKELLRNSDLRISEICEKIGYENVKHFSKLFQRIAGVKPADYRADRMLCSET